MKMKKVRLVQCYNSWTGLTCILPGFFTDALFLVQEPVQNPTLHFVVLSPLFPLTVPQSFLVFCDLKTFEEYWTSTCRIQDAYLKHS